MNADALTIGIISVCLTLVVTIWKNVDFLKNKISIAVKDAVKEEMTCMTKKLDVLEKKVDDVDISATKDFLVARFGEIDGVKPVDEITRLRIYEEMKHYEQLGGNNYVHARFEELKKQGYL